MADGRTVKLQATVKGGSFVWDDPVLYSIAVREHEGQRVDVSVERHSERRSGSANSRYWSVLVVLAKHHLNALRGRELPPLNKDQVHEVLVRAFVGQEETALGSVRCETKNLTTRQFWSYTERVALYLRENGYHVPDGREPLELEDAP